MTIQRSIFALLLYCSATDCINGTLLNATLVPNKWMNFTVYRQLVDYTTRVVDENQRFLPQQRELTIYNHSRLYINLDGCVNTLRGECRQFLYTNGNDGDNFTAQSRFPCFYNKVSSPSTLDCSSTSVSTHCQGLLY